MNGMIHVTPDPMAYADWRAWRTIHDLKRPEIIAREIEVKVLRHYCPTCLGQGSFPHKLPYRTAHDMSLPDWGRGYYTIAVLCETCDGRRVREQIVAVAVG